MFQKSDTTHGYLPVTDEAFALGFYLTGAGRERIAPHQPYPLESHPEMYQFSWSVGRILPEYQLIFLNDGAGEFHSTATGLVPIAAGAALLLAPDIWHRYRPHPQTGWEAYWLSFNGTIPHLWQSIGVIRPTQPVLQIGRSHPVINQMETVVRAAVEKSDTGITASFLALAALGDVLAIASRLPNSSDSKPIDSGTVHSRDPVVHATMNLIWNYSHRNLSVAGIARQLGITRRKLERRFQAVRAETVQDVLVQCRLTRAKRMLRETRLPIKRIATAAGFSSPAYMARVFRNKLNTTPRQYRGAEKSVTGL